MYSLGEIEAQCKKASKGVGLSWGLAEEAGLIARHLSEFNLPGSDTVYTNLKLLVAVLKQQLRIEDVY